jgi:outer membrane receptor protein involved in Fe transport
VAPGAPGQFAGDLDQRNVSWRGGVDWKPAEGLLVYANVAKGFKAGSFPTLSGSAFVQYLPVREESVLSYETGTKVALFDHRVEMEVSAFYYDYKDKQLRSKILAEPFGILDVLQNIPKSTVKGAEWSINSRPFSGLTLNVAATYLQATIDQFSGINAGGLAANFADTPMPFTPKWQIGTNADYTFSVSNGWDAFVGASVNFRSNTIAIVGGNLQFPVSPYNAQNGLPAPSADPYSIDQYTLVDLRAGVQSKDEKWRFSL